MSQDQVFREFTRQELIQALSIMDNVDDDTPVAFELQDPDGRMLDDQLVMVRLDVGYDIDGQTLDNIGTYRWVKITIRQER